MHLDQLLAGIGGLSNNLGICDHLYEHTLDVQIYDDWQVVMTWLFLTLANGLKPFGEWGKIANSVVDIAHHTHQ